MAVSLAFDTNPNCSNKVQLQLLSSLHLYFENGGEWKYFCIQPSFEWSGTVDTKARERSSWEMGLVTLRRMENTIAWYKDIYKNECTSTSSRIGSYNNNIRTFGTVGFGVESTFKTQFRKDWFQMAVMLSFFVGDVLTIWTFLSAFYIGLNTVKLSAIFLVGKYTIKFV